MTYLEENEECEEESEAEKLLSGMKIFRSKEKGFIKHKAEGIGLASKFTIRTCAIQGYQKTVIFEIFEPVQLPVDKLKHIEVRPIMQHKTQKFMKVRSKRSNNI